MGKRAGDDSETGPFHLGGLLRLVNLERGLEELVSDRQRDFRPFSAVLNDHSHDVLGVRLPCEADKP